MIPTDIWRVDLQVSRDLLSNAQLAGEPLVVSGFRHLLFHELDVYIYLLDSVFVEKSVLDLG